MFICWAKSLFKDRIISLVRFPVSKEELTGLKQTMHSEYAILNILWMTNE